jgi:pimeloyl-ACP methyl ester carboxylesterase
MPYVKSASGQLWTQTEGAGEDVLLIAGLAQDGAAWDAQVDVLARYFRVTVFDNRGTGGSSAPPPPWTVGDFARDALAVLDGLGIADAHVIGSGLGAVAAQELAAAAPARVRSLVLNASWIRADGPFRALVQSWIATAEQPGSLSDVLAVIALSVTPTALDAAWIVDRRLDAADPGDALDDARARAAFIAAARAALAYDAQGRLAAIAAPTLLTAGEMDEVLGRHHARAVASAIPHAVLAILEGCGHQPFQEDPAAFNELVGEFLVAAGRRAVAA